jgi:hypothetical protein
MSPRTFLSNHFPKKIEYQSHIGISYENGWNEVGKGLERKWMERSGKRLGFYFALRRNIYIYASYNNEQWYNEC